MTPAEVDGIAAGYAGYMRSWGAAERTIEARSTMAKARLIEWGLDFTTVNIQTFLGRRPEWSRWTRATYHSHLKSFCEYLTVAGYLEASPMDAVRRPSHRGRHRGHCRRPSGS